MLKVALKTCKIPQNLVRLKMNQMNDSNGSNNEPKRKRSYNNQNHKASLENFQVLTGSGHLTDDGPPSALGNRSETEGRNLLPIRKASKILTFLLYCYAVGRTLPYLSRRPRMQPFRCSQLPRLCGILPTNGRAA